MIANTKSLLTIVLASGSIFAQGSLTPPSGPAPSMKTLGQIEPRVAIDKAPARITLPGAYYLTTNIAVAVGGLGITVDASNVTLDLNGFVVSGAAGSEAAIAIVPGRTAVTVRNGTITATGSGVEASGATHIVLDALQISRCSEV